eukprot:8360182-Pyramimonas_sp.AAC.1
MGSPAEFSAALQRIQSGQALSLRTPPRDLPTDVLQRPLELRRDATRLPTKRAKTQSCPAAAGALQG